MPVKSSVLIIDDDPGVAQMLRAHLSMEGFDVAVAGMAEEGYSNAVTNHPDLIFLDVMLPDATGFQMLGRLRENPMTKSIPIIMMSGTARHANQKVIGKNMGADAYIVKPFEISDVDEQVRLLVKTQRQSPPLSKPHPDHEPTPRPMLEQEPEPVTDPEPQNVQFSGDPVMTDPTEKAPAEIPEPIIFQKTPFSPRLPLRITASLFALHLAATMAANMASRSQALSYAIGGWALLLGFIVAMCAFLKIKLEAAEALQVLGWAAIPIVARTLLTVAGVLHPVNLQLLSDYWLRPLDLFEISSLIILGIFVRRRPGSSTRKSLIMTLFVALGWCLTSRGFFLP